jgi:hypothetical protein
MWKRRESANSRGRLRAAVAGAAPVFRWKPGRRSSRRVTALAAREGHRRYYRRSGRRSGPIVTSTRRRPHSRSGRGPTCGRGVARRQRWSFVLSPVGHQKPGCGRRWCSRCGRERCANVRRKGWGDTVGARLTHAARWTTARYDVPATFWRGHCIAQAHEGPRNESNNNAHEPTSGRSTHYGSGHPVRLVRDIGHIFSSGVG